MISRNSLTVLELTSNEPVGDLSHVRIYAPDVVRIGTESGSVTPKPGRDIAFTTLRHAVVHDLHNFAWWATPPSRAFREQELYNVLIYNMGWYTPDDSIRSSGQHGHACYTQNYVHNGAKRFMKSVLIKGFGGNLRLYGSNSEVQPRDNALWEAEHGKTWGADTDYQTTHPIVRSYWQSDRNKLANYQFVETIFVGDRTIVGGEKVGAHNIHFDGCLWLDSNAQMGYRGQNGVGSILRSVLGSLWIGMHGETGHADDSGSVYSWFKFDVQDSVIVLRQDERIEISRQTAGWDWHGNTIYSEDEEPFIVRTWDAATGTLGRRRLGFDEWKALTGLGNDTTFIHGQPEKPIIRVVPIEGGGDHLANVAIVNPQGDAEVEVDLSMIGLQGGKRYLLRQVRDFDGDVRGFVYDGQPVKVAMTGTIAPPLNWNETYPPPIPANNFPYRGVFRVEAVSETP